MQMVGEGSIFERGAYVPVTHLAFFKPPATAFLSELKSKDRRSAKEWEYVNAAGVWLDFGQAAFGDSVEWGGLYDNGSDVQVFSTGGKGFWCGPGGVGDEGSVFH
jgi:hypothetical protein